MIWWKKIEILPQNKKVENFDKMLEKSGIEPGSRDNRDSNQVFITDLSMFWRGNGKWMELLLVS